MDWGSLFSSWGMLWALLGSVGLAVFARDLALGVSPLAQVLHVKVRLHYAHWQRELGFVRSRCSAEHVLGWQGLFGVSGLLAGLVFSPWNFVLVLAVFVPPLVLQYQARGSDHRGHLPLFRRLDFALSAVLRGLPPVSHDLAHEHLAERLPQPVAVAENDRGLRLSPRAGRHFLPHRCGDFLGAGFQIVGPHKAQSGLFGRKVEWRPSAGVVSRECDKLAICLSQSPASLRPSFSTERIAAYPKTRAENQPTPKGNA